PGHAPPGPRARQLASPLLSLGRMPSPHRVALLAGLLLGAAASAQSITLNFVGSSDQVTTLARGPVGCNDQVQVHWVTSGLNSGNACTSLELWVTNGQSCADHAGTGSTDGGTDFSIGTFSLATQVEGIATTFRVSDIPGVTAAGGCGAIVDIQNAVCASVDARTSGIGGTCSTFKAGNLIVRYDSAPPDPPTMSLLAQDAKIVVRLGNNNDNDVLNYIVQHAVVPPDGGSPNWFPEPEIPATVTSKAITGLINGTTYVVRAFSLDEVDNPSAPSAEQTAVPEASNGFWAEYKAAGGHDTGGCSSSGAAVPSVLSALGVLVALLRRRR
ncbi:MAG: MXAN_2561 family MXYO-CTERM-anchored protein, partial [Myxococcaceae bacterium]